MRSGNVVQRALAPREAPAPGCVICPCGDALQRTLDRRNH